MGDVGRIDIDLIEGIDGIEKKLKSENLERRCCIYVASLWDAVPRCLSVTALRLRLVPCY